MNFIKSEKIKDLVLIEPQVFSDNRGFFLETYNQKIFVENGINNVFIQDNHSKSQSKNVLRGIHFQKGSYSQAKLIRVTQGEVFDVAVDLRPDSPSFGLWESYRLTSESKTILFIPRGFGHGFVTLTDNAEFEYKCDNLYDQSSEGGIIWNDQTLNISWPITGEPVLSDKDKLLPTFEQIKNFLVW